ncbi:hypothetical protein B0T17DRAFT_494094 [Bombardia bombarda]|uniref:DUF7729 domain-containing protein n=1 Tax=Bombardia bombarda TaxID=252184 RepID=A0AA39WU38_9PEZI|nr:hypothetical protein B0T17DRAFT_494094 [Bombardia bombarda]
MRKRAVASSTESVSTTLSVAVASSKSSSSVAPSPTAEPSPLPSPLDGSLSSNFTTSSCPAFINSFLADPTFQQCYPFSLLLEGGSRSLFTAYKSIVSITQVLDASCAANVTLCNNYFQGLVQKLTTTDNCAADYNLGNPVVVQTYVALKAYAPTYTATCTKDPESSAYCFAETVTSNLSNVYIYFLPFNMSLANNPVPTCNSCLQNVMSVYHSATANRKQFIANTYVAAANNININCGPDFVNQTLAAEVVSSNGLQGLAGGPSLSLLATLSLVSIIPWLL